MHNYEIYKGWEGEVGMSGGAIQNTMRIVTKVQQGGWGGLENWSN